MEELTNRNKHEFLALCKQEFESFSAENISRPGGGYTLNEATKDAVVSFKQEHNRYPKIFEFLQYVSRMFAVHSPINKKRDAYLSYYRDKDNSQIGEFFRRIAVEDVFKVLNCIAYNIQQSSTHTHCVKQVKNHFSQICVYPDKKYYKDFPDEIPEYVMLNADCERSKKPIKDKAATENLDFKKAQRKVKLEELRRIAPTFEEAMEKVCECAEEAIKLNEEEAVKEKAKVASTFEIIR